MVDNRYSSLNIDDSEYNVRHDAFQILSDKSKLDEVLTKTKMCNKKNCNKVNCNYAHSKSELRIRKCLFGDDCIYKHSKNKMCKFIHPDETVESYNNRISCCEKIKKIIL